MKLDALFVLAGLATVANVAVDATSYARAHDAAPPRQVLQHHDLQSSQLLSYVLGNNNDMQSRHDATRYVEVMGIEPGMTLADIGCGTGFHTLAASGWVGPTGRVYGVDIDAEEVAYVQRRAEALGLTNVTGVVSGPRGLGLPAAGVDRMLLINVLHCMLNGRTEHDPSMRKQVLPFLRSLRAALRPKGLLLVSDQPPEVMHDQGGVSLAVARSLMRAAGFAEWHVEDGTGLYVLVVQKP